MTIRSLLAENRRRAAGADHARRRRAAISDQADPADHSVPARRQQRRGRPPDRDAAQREARPADHRRQPLRRGRRGRHRAGVAGARRTATRCWSSRSRTRSIPGSTTSRAATTRSSASRRSRSWPPGPNVLVVNPDLPAKNVKELIALAKKSPGKVGWASAGIGSFQHLGGELFELQAGVEIPARAVQGRRPGHDRRGRRPQPR